MDFIDFNKIETTYSYLCMHVWIEPLPICVTASEIGKGLHELISYYCKETETYE